MAPLLADAHSPSFLAMKVIQSSRARGGNRGGIGGGYAQTDPDWAEKRMARIKAEYLSLEPWDRRRYHAGLSPIDQRCLERLLHPERQA